MSTIQKFTFTIISFIKRWILILQFYDCRDILIKKLQIPSYLLNTLTVMKGKRDSLINTPGYLGNLIILYFYYIFYKVFRIPLT